MQGEKSHSVPNVKDMDILKTFAIVRQGVSSVRAMLLINVKGERDQMMSNMSCAKEIIRLTTKDAEFTKYYKVICFHL